MASRSLITTFEHSHNAVALPSDEVSIITSPAPRDNPSQSVVQWRRKVANLPEAQKRMFLEYENNDLGKCIHSIKMDCHEIQDNSLSVKIVRFFKPVFTIMNNFLPIVTTVSQAHPNPSAIVLGGVMCVLDLGIKYVVYQEKVVEALAQMEEKTNILSRFDKDVYATSEEVQLALVDVYSDILDFCSAAFNLYRHENGEPKALVRVWGRAMRNDFDDKFGAILKRYNQHMENYHNVAELYERKTQKAHRLQQLEHMKKQNENWLYSRNLLEYSALKVAEIDQNMAGVAAMSAGVYSYAEQRWIEEAKHRREKDDDKHAKKRLEILSWLPSYPMETFHEERREEMLTGTGQWLLHDSLFESWSANGAKRLLWVKGKPGSGKSVLAGLVIDTLTQLRHGTETEVSVVYLYFGSLDKVNKTLHALLWALIGQMHEQTFEIDPVLEEMSRRQAANRLELSVEKGKRVFESLLRKFKKVFVVIDGLDECVEENKVSSYFASLMSKSSSLRIIIFSRPERPGIINYLKDFSEITVDSGKNEKDIAKYIESVVASGDLATGEDLSLSQEIRDTMENNSDGMFLWVARFSDSLKLQHTPKMLREYLNVSVPNGLDDTYEESMQRIGELQDFMKDTALRVILWTANAARPLNHNEMYEAIAVKPNTKELDPAYRIPQTRNIASWCDGLIRVDNHGYYHLTHSSFRDYLISNINSSNDTLRDYRQRQVKAEAILGEICLTYVLFDRFRAGATESEEQLSAVLNEFPLLSYAATYCGHHLRQGAESSLETLVMDLVHSPSARNLCLQVRIFANFSFVPVFDTTPLHILAFFGLIKTSKSIPGVSSFRATMDGSDRYPLDYAFFGEHRDMCLWLLSDLAADDVVTSSLTTLQSPLVRAAILDWPEVIDRLIILKFDVNYIPQVDESDAETPLIAASFAGSLESVNRLLRAGADVNLTLRDNDCAFVAAVEGNHEKLIQPLLEAGADINKHGRGGLTALHATVAQKNSAILKLLLSNRADTNSDVKGFGKWTPMHEAASADWPEGIAILHSYGADIHTETENNRTPLYVAAGSGALSALKYLASLGARPRPSAAVFCAIHSAAEDGHSEIIKELVQLGDDVNSVNDLGETPLHIAATYGHKDAVKFLLENSADKDFQDQSERTALQLAISNGYPETAELLLEHCASPALCDSQKNSATHYVAHFNYSDLLSICLSKNAPVNAINSYGSTPLHIACSRGNVGCVRELFVSDEDVAINQSDESGATALHRAARQGHADIVKFLLEERADILETKEGDRPIHLAALNGHEAVVELLLSPTEITKKGANGLTPLACACISGSKALVKVLLERHAKVDEPDDYGYTPFHLALSNNHPEIAQYLFEKGAWNDIQSVRGITPLMLAVRKGMVDMTRQLLLEHCDHSRMNYYGEFPLSIAVIENQEEITDMLLNREPNNIDQVQYHGRTCLTFAVRGGNETMIRKLLAAGADPFVLDKDGDNLLYHAAYSGDADIVELMFELGLTIDGPRGSKNNPLDPACYIGSHKILEFMLKREPKANVDRPADFSGESPLICAVLRRHPKCAKLLIEHGANPLKQDSYGLDALYYAHSHTPSRLAVQSRGYTARSSGCATQPKHLQQQIIAHIEEIIHLPAPNFESYITQRLRLLSMLGKSLMLMRQVNTLLDARLCFMEAILPAQMDDFRIKFMCDICWQDIGEADSFMCEECDDVLLCDQCYPDYLEGGRGARSIPKSLEALESIEKEILSVMHHATFAMSSGMDAFAMFMLHYDNILKWMEKMMLACDRWETEHNSSGRFQTSRMIGMRCVKLTEEILKTYGWQRKDTNEENNKGRKEQSDPSETLEKRCKDLRAILLQDLESLPFVCKGHEFLKISLSECRQMAKEGVILDSSGRLTAKFLKEMLERYKEIDGWSEQDQSSTSIGVDIPEVGTRSDEEMQPTMEDDCRDSSHYAPPNDPRRGSRGSFMESSVTENSQMVENTAVKSSEDPTIGDNQGHSDQTPGVADFENGSQDQNASSLPNQVLNTEIVQEPEGQPELQRDFVLEREFVWLILSIIARQMTEEIERGSVYALLKHEGHTTDVDQIDRMALSSSRSFSVDSKDFAKQNKLHKAMAQRRSPVLDRTSTF